ncbi:hypothetical protein [Galactobacter sp.]|uniref:hypothetical protein n=1 Tax=Galactobacter sp. TaxID=2676125 RepID=UPI0025C1B9FF|nr:hypothetical protein [Galactobacter sp.]
MSTEDTTRNRFDAIVEDATRPNIEMYWDVRDLYRVHSTSAEIKELLRHGHPIPVGRGWTREYTEKHFPGWTWHEVKAACQAAGIVTPGGVGFTVSDGVKEIYFDSPTSWLVVRENGVMTCGPDAPRTTPEPEGYPTDDNFQPQPHTNGRRERSRSADRSAFRPTAEFTAESVTRRRDDLAGHVPAHLPWNIREEHRFTGIMEKLRIAGKQRENTPITEEEYRRLHNWLEALIELDVVVDYDPEAPANVASDQGGFYYVQRRPEDRGIIRDPDSGFPELKLE